MFKEIGAYDAKAKLSEILRKVRTGQRYTITIRGEPVADLVPYGSGRKGDASAAVAAMLALKKVKGISGEEIESWIAEGRT
ncbi:type II toxin-antitoxin system prevent-host-death family antitoxin [Oxalobacteraceae bacterium]|nr:type II toxin-antitoxin system prevent-host-death family antitoxin [Oxalobacteraceae bacterium]